jgi:hypothetical protein
VGGSRARSSNIFRTGLGEHPNSKGIEKQRVGLVSEGGSRAQSSTDSDCTTVDYITSRQVREQQKVDLNARVGLGPRV